MSNQNRVPLYLCTTVTVYSVLILSEDTLPGISKKGKSTLIIYFFKWVIAVLNNENLTMILFQFYC